MRAKHLPRRSWREPSIAVSGSFLVSRLLSALLLAIPILGTLFIVWAIMGWWPLQGHWLPENINKYGGIIDQIFYVILWLTGIIFVATSLVLAWVTWEGATRSSGRAPAVHGSHRLELIWSVIPGVILVFLSIYQINAWEINKMQEPMIEDADGHAVPVAPSVRVIARQFDWDFWYPGPDGEFGTVDDIMVTDELHVLLDQPVVLEIEAQDVLHSFFVPSLRLKQDVVPGMMQRVWFHPEKEGRFEIACTELCGWGHYKMKAWLHVDDPEDYDQWHRDLTAEAVPWAVEAP